MAKHGYTDGALIDVGRVIGNSGTYCLDSDRIDKPRTKAKIPIPPWSPAGTDGLN